MPTAYLSLLLADSDLHSKAWLRKRGLNFKECFSPLPSLTSHVCPTDWGAFSIRDENGPTASSLGQHPIAAMDSGCV